MHCALISASLRPIEYQHHSIPRSFLHLFLPPLQHASDIDHCHPMLASLFQEPWEVAAALAGKPQVQLKAEFHSAFKTVRDKSRRLCIGRRDSSTELVKAARTRSFSDL